jgi:acetolactate synthase small subunit
MQIKPRIYLVAEIPSTTAQADIDKLVEVFRAGVADTTDNLLTLAIAGQK